ncbi:MAG: GNAT family N-acetyltransferase [Candidatus Bathycorpusculaceae bacterium]
MQEIKIRPATNEDFKAIGDMIVGWLKWKIERAKTFPEVLRDSHHLVLVAELNGQIVGMLHLLFYLDILHGGINSHVLLLFVREEFRRRRIGKRLLDEAVRQAVKRGVVEMHIDTTFEEAAKFYRKYGFKDNGVMLELQLKNTEEAS